MVDQVLEKLRVSCQAKEGTEEPTVSKFSLLDISRRDSILHHLGATFASEDFLRTLPFNIRASPFGRLNRIEIKRAVIRRPFRITPRLLRILDVFLNLLHD